MKKHLNIDANTSKLINLAIFALFFISIILFFNKMLYGSFLTNDFWNFISGLIETVAAFIAIIIFLRKVIITNLYMSTYDYSMETFYDEFGDKIFNSPSKLSDKEIENLQRIYIIQNFSMYLNDVHIIQKFILKSYSFFSTSDWDLSLELRTASRKDWFNNDI